MKMQNNNWLWWTLVFALLLAGFITGWTTKPSNAIKESYAIKIHDTLKTTSVQYKIIPGTDYNIDSLITVINQFWKDSLKNMYGKGLFESKFSKTDDLGIRNYTYTSRIPPDPASSLIVDESFVFPKKTLGLIAGINTYFVSSVGLKYYFIDHKNYTLSGHASGDYDIVKKSWKPNVQIELEIGF
jgi:hypothetical protein